jgi:hypothetical protein
VAKGQKDAPCQLDRSVRSICKGGAVVKKTRKLYFSMAEIAPAMGMTVSGVRKWAIRSGAARKIAGRWKVPATRFAAAFPEAFQSLC